MKITSEDLQRLLLKYTEDEVAQYLWEFDIQVIRSVCD